VTGRLRPNHDLTALLTAACDAARPEVGIGEVAGYIPALARVDPRKLGAAIVTVDGEIATCGDADEPFTIQSISKVFTLTLALETIGQELWRRVGREPSGSAFNSIVQLERESGIPRNPLINAGAIVVCDVLLADRSAAATIAMVVEFLRKLADDPSIAIDQEVADSEAATGFRNAGLANFMKSFGNLPHPVANVLQVYFHQCAIAMNCRQLARAGLFLAARGVDPLTGVTVISQKRARRINSIMLMSGHYDASGDFAFRVGAPGKSGVGGGILAIVPDRAAVAVWSPALNAAGNSHAGTAVLEHLFRSAGWSVF
jgi:glutaminase